MPEIVLTLVLFHSPPSQPQFSNAIVYCLALKHRHKGKSIHLSSIPFCRVHSLKQEVVASGLRKRSKITSGHSYSVIAAGRGLGPTN